MSIIDKNTLLYHYSYIRSFTYKGIRMDFENKREHPRVYFTVSDGIVARFFSSDDHQELQTAYILNLSEGGLFFTLRKDQNNLIKEGDNLRFVEIKKWRTNHFLVNIQANVVWQGNIPDYDSIGIGCKFSNISDKNLQNIKELVGERIPQKIETN